MTILKEKKPRSLQPFQPPSHHLASRPGMDTSSRRFWPCSHFLPPGPRINVLNSILPHRKRSHGDDGTRIYRKIHHKDIWMHLGETNPTRGFSAVFFLAGEGIQVFFGWVRWEVVQQKQRGCHIVSWEGKSDLYIESCVDLLSIVLCLKSRSPYLTITHRMHVWYIYLHLLDSCWVQCG